MKVIFLEYLPCLCYNSFVLDGELAVPCNLQSAIAGVMSGLGLVPVWLPFISGVEVWVLRNGCLRTVSGWEQSSTKQNFPCAVRVPGGVNCKGNAYGFMFEAGRTVFEFYKDGFSGI